MDARKESSLQLCLRLWCRLAGDQIELGLVFESPGFGFLCGTMVFGCVRGVPSSCWSSRKGQGYDNNMVVI